MLYFRWKVVWAIYIDFLFVKVKILRVLLVQASHLLYFFGFLDFRPNDLIEVFCVEFDHIFLFSELTGVLFRAENLDSAFEYEIAFIARRAIPENSLILLKLLQNHCLVALVHCNLVSLVLEILQKLVLEEE